MPLKRRRNLTEPASTRCPLAKCMSLLSGAWAPHVLWALSSEPRRFSELRADLPGVSAKVLTSRLRALEGKMLVRRYDVATTSPPTVEYALTDLGRELLPVIRTMAEVGNRVFDRMSEDTKAALGVAPSAWLAQ
jgi:DNA-binding HxlR family transcriptional regulator